MEVKFPVTRLKVMYANQEVGKKLYVTFVEVDKQYPFQFNCAMPDSVSLSDFPQNSIVDIKGTLNLGLYNDKAKGIVKSTYNFSDIEIVDTLVVEYKKLPKNKA